MERYAEDESLPQTEGFDEIKSLCAEYADAEPVSLLLAAVTLDGLLSAEGISPDAEWEAAVSAYNDCLAEYNDLISRMPGKLLARFFMFERE
jgi:hypothetical protein